MYVSQQYQLMMQQHRDIQKKQIEQNYMMMQKAHQYQQPMPAGFVPSTNMNQRSTPYQHMNLNQVQHQQPLVYPLQQSNNQNSQNHQNRIQYYQRLN